MPQTNFLDVARQPSDSLRAIESKGDQLYFPSWDEAKTQYLSTFAGDENKLKEYYDYAENQYGRYRSQILNDDRSNIFSTHSNAVNQKLGLPQRFNLYGAAGDVSEVKVPFLLSGENKPFQVTDEQRFAFDRDFYIDENGKRQPMKDKSDGYYTVEMDEDKGVYLKKHSGKEDLKGKEVMSVLGPQSFHSTWIGSAVRGVLNGTLTNVPSAVGSFTETIDDLYDAIAYGVDRPGSLENFSHEAQNISSYLTRVNRDEQEGTFDNANAFIYNVANGLGSTLQAVGASYMFGGAAKGLGIPGWQAISRGAGVGVGAMVMGDAFRRQAAQYGIPDTDAAAMYIPMAGITALTETKFGPNVFIDAFINKYGNKEAQKVIGGSIAKSLKQMGLESYAQATGAQKTVLQRLIGKNVATDFVSKALQNFKNMKTSWLSGALEEGGEEVIEQTLQNATQSTYDLYRRFNNGTPGWLNRNDPNSIPQGSLAAGHGLFGQDFSPASITQGDFANFVVGAIAGGIGGKLMGRGAHQEKLMSDFYANNKEDILHETLDKMYEQGLLGSKYHDVNGKVIPTGAMGQTESLNDVAYSQLKDQMDAYSSIKRNLGITDSQKLNALGGPVLAAQLIELHAQKNKIQAQFEASQTDPSQAQTGLQKQLQDINNKIAYIEDGTARRHIVLNAAIQKVNETNKLPAMITAQSIDQQFRGMDDYITQREQENQQREQKRNEFLTGEGPGSLKDYTEQIKQLTPDKFDDSTIKLYTDLAAKAVSLGATDEARSLIDPSLKQYEKAAESLQEVDPETNEVVGYKQDTPDDQINMANKVLGAREGVEKTLTQPAEPFGVDPVAEAKNFMFSIPVKRADGTNGYMAIEDILSNLEGQERLDDPTYLQQLLGLKLHLGAQVAPMMDYMKDAYQPLGDDETFTPRDLKHVDDNYVYELPDDKVKDRIQHNTQRINDLLNRYDVESNNRRFRQERLRKNHILISYDYLGRIMSRVASELAQTEAEGLKKEFDLLQNLIFKGRRRDQVDLVEAVSDEEFSAIERQLVTVESLMYNAFNSKNFDFPKFLETAVQERLFDSMRSDPQKQYRGNYVFHEFDQQPLDDLYDYRKISANTNDADPRERTFINHTRATTFINYLLTMKRMNSTTFYQTFNNYVKAQQGRGTVSTLVPTFEQEVNIKQALGFLLDSDSSPIQRILKAQGYTSYSQSWLNHALFYRGFAGAGKTTVSMKVLSDLYRQINKDAQFTVVGPSANVMNSLIQSTGAKIGLTLEELQMFRDNPSKLDNTNVLVIDEASTLRNDQFELLRDIVTQKPQLRIILLGDESQNVNVNEDGETEGLAMDGKVEKTLPLTEVYRSGLVDLWKTQSYYRNQIYTGFSQFSNNMPPVTYFDAGRMQGVRYYGKGTEDRAKMLSDFVAYVKAVPSSDAVVIVWDTPEKEALVNSGVLEGIDPNRVKTIRPGSSDYVSGQAFDKVWVDMSGVPDGAFNRAMLTAATRAVTYSALLDPRGSSLSGEAKAVEEQAADRQTAMDALTRRLHNLTDGIVSPQPEQSLQEKQPEKKQTRGRKKKSVLDVLAESTVLARSKWYDAPWVTEKGRDDSGIVAGDHVLITRVLQDGNDIWLELNGDPYNIIKEKDLLKLKPKEVQQAPDEDESDTSVKKVGYRSALDFSGNNQVPVITFANYDTRDDDSKDNFGNRMKIALLRYMERNPGAKIYYEFMKEIPNGSKNVIVVRLQEGYYQDFMNGTGKDLFESVFSGNVSEKADSWRSGGNHDQSNFIGVLSDPQLWQGTKWVSILEGKDAAGILGVNEKQFEKQLRDSLSKDDPYADQIVQYQLFNLRLRKKALHESTGSDRKKLFEGAGFRFDQMKGANVLYREVSDPKAIRSFAQLRSDLSRKTDRNFLQIGEPYVDQHEVTDANGQKSIRQRIVADVTYLTSDGPAKSKVELFMPLMTEEDYKKQWNEFETNLTEQLKRYGDKKQAVHKFAAINVSSLIDTLNYNRSLFTKNNAGKLEVIDSFKDILQVNAIGRLELTRAEKADEQIKKLNEVFTRALSKKMPLRLSAVTRKAKGSLAVDVSDDVLQTRAYNVHFPQVKGVIDPTLVTPVTAGTLTPTQPQGNEPVEGGLQINPVKRGHQKPAVPDPDEARVTQDQVRALLSRILGDKVVEDRVRFVEEIMNGNTPLYGLMENAFIKLEDQSGIEKSTPRHEAMHFVVNYLLTEGQKNDLLRETRDYLSRDGRKVTELDAEEWLAEQYGKRYEGVPGVINKFLDRIRATLRNWGLYRDDFRTLMFDIESQRYRDHEFMQDTEREIYRPNKKKAPAQDEETEENNGSNNYTDYARLLDYFSDSNLKFVRRSVAEELLKRSNFNKNLRTRPLDQAGMIERLRKEYKEQAGKLIAPNFTIDGTKIVSYEQLDANNVNHPAVSDKVYADYVMYRLAQDDIFYRFVQKIFPDYDVKKHLYYPLIDQQDYTPAELYEVGGDDSIQDDNMYRDVSGKLSSFVHWIVNTLSYHDPATGEVYYINPALMESRLTMVAALSKSDGNQGLFTRQESFIDALDTMIENAMNIGDVTTQLKAFSDEFYNSRASNYSAMFQLASQPKVTEEQLNNMLDKLSHKEFVDYHTLISQAISRMDYNPQGYQEWYEQKRKASASLLSALETHYLSITPRNYGSIQLNFFNIDPSYQLRTSSSNVVSDIKQEFKNALLHVMYSNNESVLSRREAKEDALMGSNPRYKVGENGITDYEGNFLVQFNKDKSGKIGFSFGKKYLGDNSANVSAIRNAFNFLGLRLSRQTVKMFLSNSPMFNEHELYRKNQSGPDRLAEILGWMYITTMSSYHENPTNAKGEAVNPWYRMIQQNESLGIIGADSAYDLQEGDPDEPGHEHDISQGQSRIYTPMDLYRHLEQLALAESYSRSQGYRSDWYDVNRKRVYFNILSSSLFDKLGNSRFMTNANQGLAHMFNALLEQFPEQVSAANPFYDRKHGINNPLVSLKRLKSGQFDILRLVPFTGIRKFNGVYYSRMTEKDYLDASLKTFINHMLKQENKKEQTFITPWHTPADKNNVPWAEVNLGTDKMMDFDGTYWSINKKWVLENTRNRFFYELKKHAVAINDVMQVLSSGGVRYDEESMQQYYRDPTLALSHVQTQFARMTPEQIRATPLINNYHYRIEGNSVLPGNVFSDLKYSTSAYNEIFSKKTADEQYDAAYKKLYLSDYSAFSTYRQQLGWQTPKSVKGKWTQPRIKWSDFEGTMEASAMPEEDYFFYKTEAEKNGGYFNLRTPNPFLLGYFYAFHFTDAYMTPLVLGDYAQFKNIVDYFKRSAGPLAPGWVAATSNYRGIGKLSNIAIVDDSKMTVQNHALTTLMNHTGSVVETDGFSIYNPIFHALLRRSVGPGESAIPTQGMLKDVYHDVDPLTGAGLYLKKAALVASLTIYNNSQIVREMTNQMLGEYTPLFQQMLASKPWNEAVEAVADQVIADGKREQMIGQVVFLSAVKQGAHNITQPGQPLQPIQINNEQLRFQLNPEQRTENETVTIATQIAHEMALGLHNRERTDAVYKALSDIVNLEMRDVVQTIAQKMSGGMSEAKAFQEFLRDHGIDQSNNSGDIGQLMQMLRDRKVSVEIPFIRSILMRHFVNRFNKAIKPPLKGIRLNQAPAMFDVYEDAEGNVYMGTDIAPMDDQQKLQLGIKPIGRRLNHYRFLDASGADVTQPGGIAQIKPVEIVVPFGQLEKFGIDPQKSLQSLFMMQDPAGNWINIQQNTVQKLQTMLNTLPAPKNANEMKQLANVQNEFLKRIPAYEAIIRSRDQKVSQLMARINEINQTGKGTKEVERLQYAIQQIQASPVTADQIIDWYNKLDQALTVFMSRVPASNTSAGFAARIVGFVNDASNTVFIPSEKNILDGSDYDIDQLSMYYRDIENPGSPQQKDKVRKSDKMRDAVNSIIDNTLDYYMDPRNIPYFMLPLDLSPMRKINVEGQHVSSKPYDVTTSLQQRDRALSGKYLVGIFARSIKAYTQLLYAAAHDRSVIGNMDINLQGINHEGRYIIEFLGQLLNLATDNAKEMKLGEWGMNSVTANVVTAMAVQGMTPQETINYINDPDIDEFFSEVLNSRSINEDTIDPMELVDDYISHAENKEPEKLQKFQGLKRLLQQGQQLFRLSEVLSSGQGLNVFDFEFNKYIDDSEFYMGQSLSDLGSEDINGWAAMRGTNYDQDYHDEWSENEQGIRSGFNISKAIATNPWYKSILGAARYIKNQFNAAFIHDSDTVNQIAKEFLAMQGIDRFDFSTSYYNFYDELQRWLDALYLDQYQNQPINLDSMELNLARPEDRDVFMKTFPSWFLNQKASVASPNARQLFDHLVMDSDDYGTYLTFNNTYSLTDEMMIQLQKQFRELPQHLQQMLFNYQLVKDGLRVHRGSLVELFPPSFFENYSLFLQWVSKVDQSGLPLKLSTGKVMKLQDLLRESFLEDVALVNSELAPAMSTIKKKSQFYDRLPRYAKKTVLTGDVARVQVFKMQDGQNSDHYYEPVNHIYNTRSNPYDPSKSGLTREKTFKRLNEEKYNALKRDGRVTISFVNRVSYENGEYIIPDGSRVELRTVGTNKVELRLLSRQYSVALKQEAPRITQEKLMWLTNQLKKAIGLNVEFYTNKDLDRLNVGSNIRSFIEKGKVYINLDTVTADSATHEFSHVYVSLLEYLNPSLYRQFAEEVKHLPLFATLRSYPEYADLSEDDYLQEVMATHIGIRSIPIADRLWSESLKKTFMDRVLGTVKEVYRTVNNWLSKQFGIPVAEDGDQLLPVADQIAQALLAGKKLPNISDADIQEVTGWRHYQVGEQRIDKLSDLKKVLYEGFGSDIGNDTSMISNILDYVKKQGLNQRGKYFYGDMELSGTTDAELTKQITGKVIPSITKFDSQLKDGVVSLVKDDNADPEKLLGKAGVQDHVVEGLRERIDFSSPTDEVFRLTSKEAQGYFAGTPMQKVYDELTTTFAGYDPVIVIHNAKNSDPAVPLQISLFDVTNHPLRSFNKYSAKNILAKVLTEVNANAKGIRLRNSEGGHRGLALALTALRMQMANPELKIRNVDVISMTSRTINSEYVYIPDYLKQLTAMASVPEIADKLGPQLKAVFDYAAKVPSEKFDQSYFTSLYRLYRSMAADTTDPNQQRLYEDYANTVVNYLNGKSTSAVLSEVVSNRMKVIEQQYTNQGETEGWLDDTEHKYLSGLLYELNSKRSKFRNVMRDLSGIGVFIKGNMRVDNDIVSWAVEQLKNNLNWISSHFYAFKQEHNRKIDLVLNEYLARNPGARFNVLTEQGTRVFERLFVRQSIGDKSGIAHQVYTGEIHWNPKNPLTSAAIAAGEVSNAEVEYGAYVVEKVREAFVDQLKHQYELSDEEALRRYNTLWKDGMIPYMKKSVSGQLFRGNIKGALTDFVKDYTKSDAIFEQLRDQNESTFEIGDKFMWQLGAGQFGAVGRSESLGLEFDPVSGKTVVVDEHANDDFDTNLERVMDYFQLWNIRKSRLDNNLLPKLNAAKSLLYAYNNSSGEDMKKWIKYLDLLKERLVFGHIKRFDTWLSTQGVNVNVDNVLNNLRTLTSFGALTLNVPLALNSLGMNALQIFTNSIANYASNDHFFNSRDMASAIAAFHTPEGFNKVMKLINQFQLVNMDERSLLLNPMHKHGLQKNFLFQSEYMYWLNYGTDYWARGMVMAAQMLHDGTWDAYHVDDDGKLVYDESKDRRWDGENGSLLKENLIQQLKSQGWMNDTDKKLPQAYDLNEARRMKEFVDMQVIGSMDPTTYRNLNTYSLGRIFSQFRNYLFDKVENLYARPYFNDAMGHWEVIDTEDGRKEVRWNKMLMEGKLNSLFNAVARLRNVREQGLSAWSDMSPYQKRNLLKIGTDVSVFAVLYTMFRYLMGADDDFKKDPDEGFWATSVRRLNGSRLYRTVDYTLMDLVMEYKLLSFKLVQNPFPVVDQMVRLGDIASSMVKGDMQHAATQAKRTFPAGGTYQMIEDIIKEANKK